MLDSAGQYNSVFKKLIICQTMKKKLGYMSCNGYLKVEFMLSAVNHIPIGVIAQPY